MTDRPWLRLYGDLPADPDVPDTTMYEAMADAAATYPRHTALVYLGRRISYEVFLAEVERCAAAFLAHGIRPGDSVTLSMPNVPNTVIMFYALNRIGARAVMTHPLSSPVELEHYVRESGSRWAVTVDMFYGRFREVLANTGIEKLVIARFSDYLSHAKRLGFNITRGRKIDPVPTGDPRILPWRDFMRAGTDPQAYERRIDPADSAVVLFSGGTSSLPKGIELSSASFTALAVSMRAITGLEPGQSVLAILPVFHGFGLGLCVHTPLTAGGCSILVPEFSASIYIDNLIKHSPSFIAGVPTLFHALLQHPKFAKVSFARLRGAYCGGDSLTSDLKRRFDAALAAQGASVELLEGYGLTECVTACTLSPPGAYREDSIGIPIPGMRLKVADPSGEEVPYGEDGEICVTGPTLMLGYLNEPAATADTLRSHADGRVWLHTGDIATMDADGYLYFKGRQKRLIKVSGFSVFPAQVEQVLEAHPGVRRACVIGTPDDHQVSAVKAYVVLADDVADTPQLREDLLAHCRKHLMKWAVPRTLEIRDSLPTTLVGKIAYTQLEREEASARGAAGVA